jgi:hypothetical protein
LQKAETSLRDLLKTRSVVGALCEARGSWTWQDVYRSVLTFFRKEAEKILAVRAFFGKCGG